MIVTLITKYVCFTVLARNWYELAFLRVRNNLASITFDLTVLEALASNLGIVADLKMLRQSLIKEFYFASVLFVVATNS